MAAGAIVFPNLAKFNITNATNLLAANTSNFKLALVSSAWTPAPSTDEVWADVSTHQIANGNGYVTGGGSLTSVTLTHTAGTIKFTSAAFTWTASGGGIPAWRYGVVYYSGVLNGLTNPIVGYFLGDSTPADVPATSSGNPLTVTPNGSGWVSVS